MGIILQCGLGEQVYLEVGILIGIIITLCSLYLYEFIKGLLKQEAKG